MKTIWKYELNGLRKQILTMPKGAEILTAQAQGRAPCIWAVVDSQAPVVRRRLSVQATGQEPFVEGGKYVGTMQLDQGRLIFHVFDHGEEMYIAHSNNVDLSQDELFNSSWGLVYQVVCAPKSWSAGKVSDVKSVEDPPGTSLNRWVITEAKDAYGAPQDFKGGNPIQCPDHPDRQHWLMNC